MALEAATRYCLMNGVTSIHHMTEPHDRNRGGRGRDLVSALFSNETALKALGARSS